MHQIHLINKAPVALINNINDRVKIDSYLFLASSVCKYITRLFPIRWSNMHILSLPYSHLTHHPYTVSLITTASQASLYFLVYTYYTSYTFFKHLHLTLNNLFKIFNNTHVANNHIQIMPPSGPANQ